MARIKSRAARRKYTCGRCLKDINPGDQYLQSKPGFRSRTKLIRCTTCGFRQSELTTSKMSGAYAAIESAQDDLPQASDSDELTQIRDTTVASLQEIADEYREASSAWSGGQNAAMDEKAETVDEAINELEQWDIQDEPEACEAAGKEDGHDEGNQEGCADCEELKTTWLDDQRNNLDEVLGGLSF